MKLPITVPQESNKNVPLRSDEITGRTAKVRMRSNQYHRYEHALHLVQGLDKKCLS